MVYRPLFALCILGVLRAARPDFGRELVAHCLRHLAGVSTAPIGSILSGHAAPTRWWKFLTLLATRHPRL